MRRARKSIALLIVTLTVIYSMPPGMGAQSNNQAALVVRHGDNDVRTACVDFDEPQITGYELLLRAEYEVQLDAQGMGALMCNIGGTGCPANDCLCQCKGGGDCTYWSYWHQLDETWQYSQGGASVYMVEPSTIEGWSWGPGDINQAVPPPDLTFEDVCQAVATDTPTPSPTATNTKPPILITPGVVETQDRSQGAAPPVPSSTATSSPTAQPTATQPTATQAVNTFTPVPLRQQSEATTMPTDTPLPPQATVPVVVPSAAPPVETVVERSSQDVVEEGVEIAEVAADDALPTENNAEVAIPTPVTVARRINPDTGAATSFPDTQKAAAPTAEPTAPLQVIGEGVVPPIGADSVEPNIAGEDPGSPLNSDTMPYLVFLFIIAGLAGLLGFVSLRRRRQP